MTTILVCGGRGYADHARVHEVLYLHAAGASAILQGGAPGADRLARDWAEANGILSWTIPAEWRKHGKAAGPIRNQRMLDAGEPALVIAFPGGRGTADMVRRARAAGVPVLEVTE